MAKRIHARVIIAAAAVVSSLALGAHSASADTLFWDADGDASAATGGTGTWDTTSSFWRNGSLAGALDQWTDAADNANFGLTAGTVTIPALDTRTAGSVTFSNSTGSYTIAGGTLHLTNPTSSFVMDSSTGLNSVISQNVTSNLTGTDITVANNYNGGTVGFGNARTQLILTGTNTFTGNLILGGTGVPTATANGNFVHINNTASLPTTANVVYSRSFSQLVFGSGGIVMNHTFANNFNLNSGITGTATSTIGVPTSGTVVTLSGQLTGTANLDVRSGLSGGLGTLVLTNTSNNYTGATQILLNTTATQTGLVKLGATNALPTTTSIVFAGTTGPAGGFDMAGFNQKVTTINTQATGLIAGIVNSTASPSTLTIDGVVTGTYRANIGIPTTTTGVAGATDNIALNLASTNVGTLNITTPTGTTYSGGTTISGGTLNAGNTSGSATGTGPVTVNSGGRLGSVAATGGIIGTNVNVTSGGSIVPGGVGTIGNINLAGGLTGQTGANLNFEVGSGNDTLTLGGGAPLAAPGGAQSINLGLLDLGGFTENGTYTLINYPDATLEGLDVTAAGPLKIVKPINGFASQANFVLTNDGAGNLISVNVTGLADKTIWRGNTGSGSGTWDTNATPNFELSGLPIVFTSPDEVTFDDNAPNPNDNPAVVTIAGAGVSPGKVTVTGARSYTFTGGPIDGTTQIVKSGTGTLILGANNHSGGTVITQGTLRLDADSDLGAVPATPTVNLTVSKTGNPNATFLVFDAAMTINANRTVVLTQTNGAGPSINTNGFDVSILGQMLCGNASGVNLVKDGLGTLTLRGNNATNIGGSFINAVRVNGGFVNADADVNLGQANTSISLFSGGLQLGGSFAMGNRSIGVNAGGGTVDTNGFNTSTGGVLSGAGAFTKTGAGTLTLTGTNTHTGGVAVNGGTLEIKRLHTEAFTVAAGATLRVLASAPTGTDPQSGDNAFVSRPSALTVDPAGFLDITNNDVIIDYTGASPAATYEALVRSAYNVTGDWAGPGITSSIAAADGNYVVAIADNSALAAPFGTLAGGPLFAGVDVDLDAVLIKFTHRADINLDGLVTPDDSAIFGGAYDESITSGHTWAAGDMNYDGACTPDDAAIFGGAYDESLTSLPEPGSLGVLGLLGLGLARRRRRAC